VALGVEAAIVVAGLLVFLPGSALATLVVVCALACGLGKLPRERRA
jgi:hypothetical protein